MKGSIEILHRRNKQSAKSVPCLLFTYEQIGKCKSLGQTDKATSINEDTQKMPESRSTPFPMHQGPVVQSIVSLTSSFVVKMLTVVVSKISNSQVFLLKKKM